MAIILQTRVNKLFGSIRWNIVLVFLLLLITSFFAIASTTISLVGNYQLNQRMRNDKYSVEKMAVSVTQLFLNRDISGLNHAIERLAGENDGRLMILDASGKVIADTYARAEGMRISLAETATIINGEQTFGYGVYNLDSNPINAIQNGAMKWINVCTSAIILEGRGVQGIVLFSASLDDVMNNLNVLQNNILVFFLLTAMISLLLSFILAAVITTPINRLTQGIKEMGKGDFSVRVEEKGSYEIKKLSATFNNMSEKLENLEKSRSQFISNASHELKTPLSTMKILVESVLYEESMDADLRKEFLTDVNREIDRLNSVVKDLLTLVTLDNKQISLNKSLFSLSDLVTDISGRMRLYAEKHHKKLFIHVEEDIDIYADSAKMHHIINNLIDNAIKYTEADGEINVNLYRKGKVVVFSVKDNGPGIPKKDINHIFDRFYRIDKARSRDTGGTGLGLSIVHQMVMLHGGNIYVESDYGHGAEFFVELPMAKN